MDSDVWTDIGKISSSGFDGNVSATIEALCKEAMNTRQETAMRKEEADHIDECEHVRLDVMLESED